jgi:RNA polymerase sigma-70 factor (ECF subfamily)
MVGIRNATTATDEDLATRIGLRVESAQALRAARDACTLLYQRHARKLLAFLATRVGRDDLEDVHQEVWERVWQHLPRSFRGGNFRAWLYQITRNYLIDRSRRRQLERLEDSSALPETRRRPPDELLIDQERLAILKQCLQRLGEVAAGLVQARLAGESYADICARLDLKPERAHRLFHQAKEQLQKCVERACP